MDNKDFPDYDTIYTETRDEKDCLRSYRPVFQPVKRPPPSETEQKLSKIMTIVCLMLFLFGLLHTAFSLPPKEYEYRGSFGTYTVYGRKEEIHLPDGRILTYTSYTGDRVTSFFITYPNGDELTMNTKYPVRKMINMTDQPLTEEEKDIWYALQRLIPNSIGLISSNPMRPFYLLGGIIVLAFGFSCIYLPYHVADLGMFLFIYHEEFLRSKEYFYYVKKVGYVLCVCSGLWLVLFTFL